MFHVPSDQNCDIFSMYLIADCGCNGFATSCEYDEIKGYGVCQGCMQNTTGDKCEVCGTNYYRNPNYTNPAGDNGNTCIGKIHTGCVKCFLYTGCLKCFLYTRWIVDRMTLKY